MGKFTKEIIFICGGHPRVRIGTADNAKFEWIGAQISLMTQTFTQCRTGIFVLQHLGFFIRAQGDITLIPGFKIGELIIR